MLDTARYDGSFYTSTAAAALLASLALRDSDGDWSDPNYVAPLRICDPACGTSKDNPNRQDTGLERPRCVHRLPSHSSKMVLSTV